MSMLQENARFDSRSEKVRKLAAIALAVVLTMSAVPIAHIGQAYGTSAQGGAEVSWTDCIDGMLQNAEYVDGEAVAIIAAGEEAMPSASDDSDTVGDDGDGTGGAAGSQGQTESARLLSGSEQLFEASSDAASVVLGSQTVDNAIEAAAASEEGDADGAGIAHAGASSAGASNSGATSANTNANVRVVLVRGDGMSTREILRELAEDPRVISAEPNYISYLSDDSATGDVSSTSSSFSADTVEATASTSEDLHFTDETASTSAALASDGSTQTFIPADVAQVSADSIPDITKYQWSNSSANLNVLAGDRQAGYDANVPNWNESADNAAGIVCIVDSGVDYNHPDLADSMVDLSNVMGTIGGGKYGINVTDEFGGDKTEVMDKSGHGTHVAGIIAAQWNGQGTSGAAKGAKIMEVKIGQASGAMSVDGAIEGYAYISKALDAGVDIRVINNSWGTERSSVALNLAMTEVGQKGAVSVCASGNDGQNIDSYTLTPSGTSSSPYTVIVNSSSPSGQPSVFTNYGQEKTDLFAPGAMIMSTVCQSKSGYFPSMVDELGGNVVYDTFDGTGKVEAYVGFGPDALKAENKISDVGSHSYHFDESGSLAITGAQLKAGDQGAEGQSKHRFAVTLKVPVSKADLSKVGCFGYSIVSENTSYPVTSTYVQTANSAGEVAMTADKTQTIRAASNIGWTQTTSNLKNCLAETYQDLSLVWNADSSQASGGGAGGGDDGGESGYMVVSLTLATQRDVPTDDEKVYIDCVGLGNSTLPYAIMSGTSMASPLAAAGAAICSTAVDRSQSADRRALELVSLLKSCTTQHAQFNEKCSSNATLDLSKLADRSAAQPVIDSATLDESGTQNYIDIKGSFFGSSAGTVTIGGYDANVVSWTDSAIRVEPSDKLTSGKREVVVTTESDQSSNKTVVLRFVSNPPENDVELFEESISMEGADFSTAVETTQLIGLDGYVYAFPQTKIFNKQTDPDLGFRYFYRYNIETGEWKNMGMLPHSQLDIAAENQYGTMSLALWEGKILMLARTSSGSLASQELFSYDPNSGEWTNLNQLASKIPFGAAIVNANGTIMAIGGSYDVKSPEEPDIESSLTSDNIASVDMKTGEVKVLGSLTGPRSNFHHGKGQPIQLAASGDTIYVNNGVRLVRGAAADNNLPAERLVKQDDGTYKSESLADVLPATHLFYDYSSGLAAGTDGAAFGALKVNDGDEDTYLVSNDGGAGSSGSATPLGKKASDVPLAYVTALAYHGKLYVMGVDEFSGGYAVMRATAFDTPDHPAGESDGVDPEPTPAPSPSPQPEGDDGSGGGCGAVHVAAAKSVLAKTGDAAFVPLAIAVVLAVLAVAAIVAYIVRRRKGSSYKGKH